MNAPVPVPNIQLAGFNRVQLSPGQSYVQNFSILPKQLALWYFSNVYIHLLFTVFPIRSDPFYTFVIQPLKINVWAGGQVMLLLHEND